MTSEKLPLDTVSGDEALLTPQVSSRRSVIWPTLGATLPGTRVATVILGVVALGIVAVAFADHSGGHSGPFRGSSPKDASDLVLLPKDADSRELARMRHRTKSCSKLWEQCGGEGYSGPTCCEEGDCVDYAFEYLPSFRMCRLPEPPACGEPEPGSNCFNMIQEAKGNIWQHPEYYHGLPPDSEDKEFQTLLHWTQPEESECPAPCGPGTCYMTLHIIGCDTLESWYCEHDDGSVKYACCCKYFNDEKSLEEPTDVDPDMAKAMKVAGESSPTLYCTTMVQPLGYELDLLRAQYKNGKLGLFRCNEFSLFSNESLKISPEGQHPVVKTGLIKGSLSATMGGDWNTALNTGVFIKFWDKVVHDPKAWKADWIVKVDPDTVWLPARLRVLLSTSVGPLAQPEPDAGIYLNNCHVGMHGPIEVLSRRALSTYKKGRQECATGKVSEIGQEDWFLRECFEELGILRVDAYNLMLEATLACQEVASALNPDRPPCFSPQVAFHPFKNIYTWMRCHTEAENHPWALPVVPVTDGPSEANLRHG